MPAGARAVRLVREPMPLEAPEEARLFDEALPVGLRLRGGATAETSQHLTTQRQWIVP